jgi:hypothetical protein
MQDTINSANAAASSLFLGHNGEWWDFWLIVSLVLAALIATAVGVTTAGSIVAHKREAAEAEGSLERYKLETGTQISEANARAKEAADHTAVAQLELAKLQAQLSWREFSEAKHIELSSLIGGLARPIISVVLFDSVVGNPEAKRYGDLIAKALSDALRVSIEGPRGLSTCLECTGVWVCVNENAVVTTSEDANAIRETFERVGVVGAKLCTDPRNGQGSPTTVKVLIGPKE